MGRLPPKLVALALLAMLTTALVVVSPRPASSQSPDNPRREDSKIASGLRQAIEQFQAQSSTRQSGSPRAAGSPFVNPLVKVDDLGQIQTYIQLVRTGPDDLAELESLGVVIEIVNLDHKIVQA